MSKYKALLIDNDNTLMDFEKCSYAALSQLLNYPRDIDEKFAIFFEHTNQLWVDYEKGEIDKSGLILRRTEILKNHCGYAGTDVHEYTELLTEQVEMFSDVRDTLEKLSGKYEMYVITNGMEKMQNYRLKKAGIAKYFSHVFVSDVVGCHKPDKGFFDAVLSHVPYACDELLVVGDSLTADIRGGNNAGIDTCWISYGNKLSGGDMPKYIINNLSDVSSIIDN